MARGRDVARRASLDSLFREKAEEVLDDFVFERILKLAQDAFLAATQGEEVAASLVSKTLADLFRVLEQEHYPTVKTGKDIVRIWMKDILKFKVEIPGGGRLCLESVRLRQLQRSHFEALMKALKDTPQLAKIPEAT